MPLELAQQEQPTVNPLPQAKPKPVSAAPTANTTGLSLASGVPQAPTPQAPQPSRLELANQSIETSAKATDPYYQKSLKDATSQAASVGQLGSGQLRTSLGDLSRNRALELDTLRSQAITSATNASIDDQFRARDQGLAQSQLELSSELGHGNLNIAGGQLELAKSGQAQQASQFGQSLDFKKAQADVEAAYKNGTLTLAQAQQKLAELSQQQSNTLQTGQLELAKSGQAQQGQQEAARLQVAKDQLAQAGQQFGLSLAQQKELATLADKTQNRQIDIATEQGRNALMIQLAQIMGTPGSNIPASFLAAIQKALGLTTGTTDPTVIKPVDNPVTVGINPTDIKPGYVDTTDTGVR